MIRMRGIPVLTGLLLMLGTAVAVAQGPDQVIRNRHVIRSVGYGGGQMWRDLDLNDDQKKKIEAIFDKQRRDGIKMRADLEVAGLDMRKLMQADTPDRSAINSQIDRMATMRSALRKAQVGAMLDMRAVLTPEQQKKLKESNPIGRGRMGGRRMLDMPEGDEPFGMFEGPPPPSDDDDAMR